MNEKDFIDIVNLTNWDTYPTVRSALKECAARQVGGSDCYDQNVGDHTSDVHPWSYSHIRGRKDDSFSPGVVRRTDLGRLRTDRTNYTRGFFTSRGVKPCCNDYLAPLTRQRLVKCPSLRALQEWYLYRWRWEFLSPQDLRSCCLQVCR